MLVKIRQYFETYLLAEGENAQVTPEHAEHLAAAAILIEVSRADFDLTEEEKQAVVDALRQTFELDSVEVDALIKLAEEEVSQASSLYQFTRLVNDFYAYEQKLALIAAMWQVAYADGNIDKYEEHMIRKVAELIYVRHQDFIQLKLQQGNQQQGNQANKN